ncbi:MAG TPA: type I-U CRISPR-associated protein Csb2 [Solirubrobacteraceae bacterium]|nr:type I-U CRISPR-associated protein Csb2 [Solirubrobacteraceae bacterium]
MEEALMISVRFTRDAYSGGEYGAPEPLPSPARLHAAFAAAAAAAGPWAVAQHDTRAQREVLAAQDEHAEAVRWLEEHEPLGILAPAFRTSTQNARRYRLRAARAPFLANTPFEPFTALGGPVVYAWPPADQPVARALQELACEITHVGRAEASVVVRVNPGRLDRAAVGFLAHSERRGPGLALRVARPGRFDALMHAHREALRLSAGRHASGSRGKQAPDEQPAGIGELHTRLRRFGRDAAVGWPYSEAWILRPDRALEPWMLRPQARVGLAAAVHRALVAAIADDVPPLVSGRDGDGPLRGPGHIAIHPTVLGPERSPAVVLGLPAAVPDADRAMLLEALSGGLRVSYARRAVALSAPEQVSAVPFWSETGGPLATEVPMVLDVPGTPRHAPWTLDDAVVCSVGYAMRGVLESQGVGWGTGWEFRRALVAQLRQMGVTARARRLSSAASRYCHRARPGDLLVAVDALVSLGDLDAGGGLLAIGRARHLGGGLLRPLAELWR